MYEDFVMSYRTTITLDDEAFKFLNAVAGDNRSAYISQLLKRKYTKSLKAALFKANEEEAQDPDYQEELQTWDNTLFDGLDS